MEKIAQNPKRKKVTLAWNGEDVARAISSLFQEGDAAKFIDFPQANYAALPNDKIIKDGKTIGISTFTGYSYNERSMLSLSFVERHVQTEIRAIVSPVPYSRVVREEYAEGWRTGAL